MSADYQFDPEVVRRPRAPSRSWEAMAAFVAGALDAAITEVTTDGVTELDVAMFYDLLPIRDQLRAWVEAGEPGGARQNASIDGEDAVLDWGQSMV